MSTQTALNAEHVKAVFMDCLFRDGEDTSKHVKAEGIVNIVRFHPERLESHKTEIVAILDELPEQFQEKDGGGWSFLNACNDKHGNQWTGLHQTMEQLFLLGIGVDKVKNLMPRKMWNALPGGMPYYVVTA